MYTPTTFRISVIDNRWNDNLKTIQIAARADTFVPTGIPTTGIIFFVSSEEQKTLLDAHIAIHRVIPFSGADYLLSNTHEPFTNPYFISVYKNWKVLCSYNQIDSFKCKNQQNIDVSFPVGCIYTPLESQTGCGFSQQIDVNLINKPDILPRSPKWANGICAAIKTALSYFVEYMSAIPGSPQDTKIETLGSLTKEQLEDLGDIVSDRARCSALFLTSDTIRSFLSGDKEDHIYIPSSIRSAAQTISRGESTSGVIASSSSVVRRSERKTEEPEE